jgi:zinc protease
LRPFLGQVAAAVATVSIAIASPTTAAPLANGWGVPLTDVSPDPAIHYGQLPNSLRYAVMHNATPKGTVSIRLQFAFGSIAEKDNERGLAHFIEHMAFNGTNHVPEGEMARILERHGLAFGPDANATTTFDKTDYMLDVPNGSGEQLDTALFLLREVASEIKFDPAAVDRERAVILSEERARDSSQLRHTTHLLAFELPQTPYPTRMPIGVDDVLKKASAETIRGLYDRYYRPENATLVVVGDVDPARIEALIKAKFGDWHGRGQAGPPLPRGTIDDARTASFSTYTLPSAPTLLTMTVARPWTSDVDSVAFRRVKTVEAVAAGIFNRRLQRLASAANATLLGGSMIVQDERDAGRLTQVGAVARDGAWKDALALGEQEVRRALEHGFTVTEFKLQIAEMEAQARAAADQANTRSNASLAAQILTIVGDERFITTPAYRLTQFEKFAPTIGLDEVNSAFRQLWNGSPPLVHLTAPQTVSQAELASAYSMSRAVAVAAPRDNAATAFAYDSFGSPGTIVADSRVADLGLRTVRFANNVRLNVKKTAFDAGRARFLVRMGGGMLELPKSEPGLGIMMAATSAIGGLGKHSLNDLKDLTAGHLLTFGATADDDGFVSTGSTSARDFALQMKVSAAHLTDPGFRPEAQSKWADTVPLIEKTFNSPQSVALTQLPIVLANGDARFGMPAEAAMASRNLAELRAALGPAIASAPIEITVVGDVDEADAIAAVAQSFGALPPRQSTERVDPALRQVVFRTDRSPIVLSHRGSPDQALVELAWQTDDDHDHRRENALGLLSEVLRLNLEDNVRERLGDSYSVSVQNRMSSVFDHFGYFAVSAVVAPDKIEEVRAAFLGAIADLRDNPVGADLLNRARAPVLEKLDRSLTDNGFWLGALSRAQSAPERLARVRERKSLLQQITPAELQQLARQYLPANRAQLAMIIPGSPAKVR